MVDTAGLIQCVTVTFGSKEGGKSSEFGMRSGKERKEKSAESFREKNLLPLALALQKSKIGKSQIQLPSLSLSFALSCSPDLVRVTPLTPPNTHIVDTAVETKARSASPAGK